jgi:hypothetical protein
VTGGEQHGRGARRRVDPGVTRGRSGDEPFAPIRFRVEPI